MKSASPFVIVEDCGAAVEHYQRIFGGEIKSLHEHAGKIMHAELSIGGTLIHFSATYGRPYTSGDQVKIILLCENEEEIKRVHEQLAEGGQITVPLQDTFFGALHGQVMDRNDINWVLNCFKA